MTTEEENRATAKLNIILQPLHDKLEALHTKVDSLLNFNAKQHEEKLAMLKAAEVDGTT